VILCASLMAQGFAQEQPPIRITAPAAGTVVNPGQTIMVYVSNPEEPLKGMMLFAPDLDVTGPSIVQSPPFQFAITIPQKTRPGLHAIRVFGFPTSPPKSPDPSSFPGSFAEVSIDVEFPDPPERISTTPQCAVSPNKRPHRLNCSVPVGRELEIGGLSTVEVYGGYSDGSVVDLTRSTQTTFTSESPEIATVTAEGLVRGVGPGSTHIVIDGRLSVALVVGPHVIIAPPETTLKAGQTREFVARLSSPPSGTVTWTLNPPVGSVIDGLYKAPDSIDSQQTVLLTAASGVDPSVSATAVIKLSPVVSVDIVPAYAVVYVSQKRQFSAITANAGMAGVKWSISPSGAGVIDSAGLYTAPDSISALQSVKIIATSAANPAISGNTAIYISPRPFALFIPLSALRLAPGASGQINVTLLATDRFFHPIDLAVAAVPSGVTAAFSKPTLLGNNQTTLTFTAGGAVVPGIYKVTVIARDTVYPEMTHSCELTLNIRGESN
jgi:hypothetical protein